MGDRLNVEFKFSDDKSIHLYAHWAGSRILSSSSNADGRKNLSEALEIASTRLGDKTYYTRIIISQLIGQDWSGELSWGIAPYYIDSENVDVVVDMTKDFSHMLKDAETWFVKVGDKTTWLNKDTDYGAVL